MDNVIQAGQTDIEPKMDDIPGLEWRGGELIIPAVRREIVYNEWRRMEDEFGVDREKLNKVERLISYYEVKEAATLFELALWKAKIKTEISSPADRGAYRVDVPGPVKEAILQYLR